MPIVKKSFNSGLNALVLVMLLEANETVVVCAHGYLFSKPLSCQDAEQLIDQSNGIALESRLYDTYLQT